MFAVGAHRSRLGLRILFFVIVNVAVVLMSFTLGRFSVSISELLSYLWDATFGGGWQGDSQIEHVIARIRMPRILAAVLIGAALSVAGAAYQSLFRNPLVSPDVLGASGGAGFGASLAILMGFGAFGMQTMAFGFSVVAVFVAYTISRLTQRDQILALVLGGIIVSAVFSSGTSILKVLADPNSELPAITFWLMGGLNGVRAVDLMPLAIPIILCTGILWLLRWQLDTVTFGDDTATALGVNVRLIRVVVIVCATLLTAVSVAVGGVIGWVGLIIPHLARMAFGPEHRALIPLSALIGSAFLVVVDTIARTLLTAEIPLGILTALIGAPFLAYLLMRNASW